MMSFVDKIVVLERYKTIGWSIGLSNFQISPVGNVYFEIGEKLEDGIKEGTILTPELIGMYDLVADEESGCTGQFLLDKVGGVDIGEKNIEEKILAGLEKGKEYNLEVYSGTKYYSNEQCKELGAYYAQIEMEMEKSGTITSNRIFLEGQKYEQFWTYI